ncbi:Tyrosine-protein phosphatase 69D [Lucilia cuprina]|uniref:protein-tyrosine-phosphatase n=1 Tax=Lucilia cuprina TaxID=7375 RepID=A0A0L0BLG0_LUCCU|nr:Tyrosine-protein phosphatase 69D [Lucilia cuprina]
MTFCICLRQILFIFASLNVLYLSVFIAECECKTEQTQGLVNIPVGENFTIKCFSSDKNSTWKFKEKIFDLNTRSSVSTERNDNNTNEISERQELYQITLFISNIQISDEGLYTCESIETGLITKIFIQPYLIPQIRKVNGLKVKQKIGNPVKFFCVIEIYPQNVTLQKQLKWLKDENVFDFLDQSSNIEKINVTHVNFTLELTEVYKKENGSYACVIYASNGEEITRKNIALLVMDEPKVNIEYVKAVGADKIYLNWTVNNGNDPVQKYFIQYLQEGNPELRYYKDIIGGGNTSYVLENFFPNTSYILRISAKNSIGNGDAFQYPFPVRTLERDPIFIPKVKTTGSTASTITIGWDPPPLDLIPYVQYYELVVSEAGDVPKIVEEAVYQQNSRNLPYMFDNLKTATEYEFKVRACCDLTKLCGPWSDIVNGTTMDGIASKPTNLKVLCINNNVSKINTVDIAWMHPEKPNGKVISYQIQLEGVATYKLNGKTHNETWGPKIRRIDEPNYHTTYDGVVPNTNYTVTVSAITRHRKTGESAIGKCTMPVSVPESISRIMWTKVRINSEKCVLKAFIPRVSERNGPICCYRLYLIRMKNNNAELPPPSKLNISNYHEVHGTNNTMGGVYLAEMFSGNNFKSEIFLGDGKRYFEHDGLKADDMDKDCNQCVDERLYSETTLLNLPAFNTISLNYSVANDNDGNMGTNLTDEASQILSTKKSSNFKVLNGNGENYGSTASNERVGYKGAYDVYDGEIDMNSNYTGYLEVIVRNETSVLRAYSNYFEVITPGISEEQLFIQDDVAAILNIVILFLAILIGIVLVFSLILCFVYRVNTKNTGSTEEVISLRDSLSRVLFGGRSNNHRHFIGTANGKVADIGPIHKSDLYMAYKNRHKDTDYGFLREYEMLPNRFSDRTTKNSDLKENGPKNRYPDIKAYDQTRVKLSQINGIHGSDYINANFVIGYKERKKFICAQGPMDSTINDFWRMIWEQHLEIIVMLTNLEEYNKTKCSKYWPEKIMDVKQYGDITVKFVSEKKNGDYLVRSLDIYKRNSVNEEEEESRQITQYHYLVWKDFMAPEHPQALIKFIRHINAVYSVQRGPILVHCSAGVGRTGTLVALDSLLQQLEEESQVSIFNTVCDLRHQRNFLVQSLKQYIFLYRALLDTAHLGITEINAVGLSSAIENLKSKAEDGREKCKLEIEFEKLQTINDETNKSCSVGSSEHNLLKNRSELIGEGTRRCPRYWADDEIQFEHILVKYMQSESCPYYTRREFNVTNCKINDTIHVTQFQYNGWPTVEGEVPEVCRGIIELVDQALSHHSKEKNIEVLYLLLCTIRVPT